MLFNSLAFLIFLPIVFLVYWVVLKKSLKAQNIFLLIASYVFYGWWDYRFLSLIFLSSAIDFFVGKQLYKEEAPIKRKAILAISLITNLGMLSYFKYANFFIDSFSDLLTQIGFETHPTSLQIILPVGISFFTFQTLSYTLDIYHKRLVPSQNAISFFAFVSFFPQLVAGPIERAKHLLPQFEKKRTFTYQLASSGGKLMIYGLFKKVVIADQLSPVVDMVYTNPEAYSPFIQWFATFLFAIQIYCDFSGYSDIAIGTARLLGFDLLTNFRFPYFSNSIGNFWQRWHISLSTWFRDYVYIPLGGSKGSIIKTNANTMITFIVSGFWHGANFTFVIWGALHGLFLIFERRLNKRVALPKWLQTVVVFLLVCFAWVFFRASTLQDALFIISNIVDIRFEQLPLQFRGLGIQWNDLKVLILFLLFFALSEWIFYQKKKFSITKLKWVKISYYQILVILIAFYGFQDGAKNFIYFQF